MTMRYFSAIRVTFYHDGRHGAPADPHPDARGETGTEDRTPGTVSGTARRALGHRLGGGGGADPGRRVVLRPHVPALNAGSRGLAPSPREMGFQRLQERVDALDVGRVVALQL